MSKPRYWQAGRTRPRRARGDEELRRRSRRSRTCRSISAPVEIRAICGENGAGKSTLVKILTGVYHPDAGTVTIDGEARRHREPAPGAGARHRAGGAGTEPVPRPLRRGQHLARLGQVPFFHRRAELAAAARARRSTGSVPAISGSTRRSGVLAIGERQLVEIARMLTRDARVLILDEPTATLTDLEIDRIFAALIALRREGRTDRLHHAPARRGVPPLRHGERDCVTASWWRPTRSPSIDRQALIEMMLGRSFVEMYPEPASRPKADAALVVDDLSVPGRLAQFQMNVPSGKIACIAGQVGSGAVEAITALAGLDSRSDRPDHGQRQAVAARLARPTRSGTTSCSCRATVPRRACSGALSVLDNLVATRLGAYTRFGVISRRGLKAAAAQACRARSGSIGGVSIRWPTS